MTAPARWPALPKVVQAPGGPVKVRLVNRERADDGSAAWGTYEQSTRIVRIERGIPPAHRWRVFWHELAHVWLSDAGVDEQLSVEGVETLCQAIRTGMMQLRARPDTLPEL